MPPRPSRALVTITIVMFPSLAAAEARTAQRCGDLLTTAEQKACAETAYKQSEVRLAQAYDRAMARKAGTNTLALSEAHAAWRHYRDAECRGIVGAGGGSGRTVWVWDCLTEKNRARSRELDVPFDQR